MLKLKLPSMVLSFALIILSVSARAEETKAAELFTQGTKHYLEKDFTKAADFLSQALDKDPNNPVILTNLGLAEFQLNKKNWALGHLRKAVALAPDLSPATNGLKYVLTQAQLKEVPHKNEMYENIRSDLQSISWPSFAFLSVLTFFSSGWLFISYSSRRKVALSEEKALPPFPLIATLLCFIFFASSSISIMKIYDGSVIRGTILEDQVSLQSAPGDNGVSILDLYGGAEVIISSTQGEWAQVTYPGSLTGWVKKSSLLMTR